MAVDLFLTGGEPNPNDVRLTDPTTGGSVNGTATPDGISAIASVGTVVATGDAVIAAVGVTTQSDVGSALETGDAQVSPAGVSMTAAVGTTVESSDATVAPAGVSMLADVGSASVQGDGLATPDGVAMAASVGTVDASAESFGGAQLGAFQLGAASLGGSSAEDEIVVPLPLPVAEVDAVAPLLPPRPRRVVRHAVARPAGVQARAMVGRAAASGSATVDPAGVEMVVAIGTVTASADASVQPAGVKAAATVEMPQVSAGASVPVVGVSVRVRIGRSRADGTEDVDWRDRVVPPAPDPIDTAWLALQRDEDEALVLLGVLDA